VPVPCQSEQGRVPEAVAIGRLRCKGVERDKGEGPIERIIKRTKAKQIITAQAPARLDQARIDKWIRDRRPDCAPWPCVSHDADPADAADEPQEGR
jgi:hypothetical protein